MSNPEDDESDQVRRAQAGDVAAFERLVTRHGERLFRSAMVLGGDRHWAEDLTQETLLEAWRSLQRFDGRCRFSTWLYGILRHRFLKGVRRQGLRNRRFRKTSANDRAWHRMPRLAWKGPKTRPAFEREYPHCRNRNGWSWKCGFSPGLGWRKLLRHWAARWAR